MYVHRHMHIYMCVCVLITALAITSHPVSSGLRAQALGLGPGSRDSVRPQPQVPAASSWQDLEGREVQREKDVSSAVLQAVKTKLSKLQG